MLALPRACLRSSRNSLRATQCLRLTGKSTVGKVRWQSTIAKRQWSTPLAEEIAKAIATTGPISVAAYMRQCLTSQTGGYYTSSQTDDRDQFGQKGDFVTSPEISQVFGELVGIWVVAEWMAQGRKKDGVYLLELGPGRGTLMDDMLRTIQNFKPMASSIDAVYLVEASSHLRAKQHNLLCGDAPLEATGIGYQSKSKHISEVPIVWVEDLKMLPRDDFIKRTPFVIAHEFFDALPIHIFQSIRASNSKDPGITTSVTGQPAPSSSVKVSPHEWRELVVTPTSPATTTKISSPSSPSAPVDFELSVSKTRTPHSIMLPAMSPRYQALASTSDAVIEISPESQTITQNIATRIGGPAPSGKAAQQKQAQAPVTPSGAALILDYGPSTTIPTNSLRGIRSHERVSPFTSPGLVDISADVDFRGLAESAINASTGVEVHGPVEQGLWLKAMGIEARAEMLARNSKDEEQKNRIEEAWKRLVDRGPQGMGRWYKIMAIVPHLEEKGKMRRPVGFGGDIEI